MSLDLAKMPRGSSNSKNCTLKLMDPALPTVNLFKIRKIKAWWPFLSSMNTGKYVQAVRNDLIFKNFLCIICSNFRFNSKLISSSHG